MNMLVKYEALQHILKFFSRSKIISQSSLSVQFSTIATCGKEFLKGIRLLEFV